MQKIVLPNYYLPIGSEPEYSNKTKFNAAVGSVLSPEM